MLKINKLTKYFGGNKAVNNCSFKIDNNTIVALIGPNGSGKSTIFNLISGIIKEDSGKIIFNNKDITHFSPEKVSNSGISRLFQQSQIFNNLSVKENLLLAFNNDDTKFWKNLFTNNKTSERKEEKIKQILDSIGIKKLSTKLGRELSYGQKRLIEIARTILNPHKLLVLDEPVAGVNPALRKKIINILLDLKKQGATILLIEHDMNFALKLADNIIVLDKGKVIAEGSPKSIKNNKKVLDAYLGN